MTFGSLRKGAASPSVDLGALVSEVAQSVTDRVGAPALTGFDEHVLDHALHVLAAKTPFADLLDRETVRLFWNRGCLDQLAPFEIPVLVRGIDRPTPGALAYFRDPTLEELEGVEDKERLARLLLDLDFRGTCPRSKALIRSVEDVFWFGTWAQTLLEPRRPPGPRVYPWWWPGPPRRRRRPPPGLLPIWEACD